MVSKIRFVKDSIEKNFAYVPIKWQFQFPLRNCLLNSLRIAGVAGGTFTAFVVFYEAANLPNSRALFFLFASITVHACRSLQVRFAADLENRSFPVCCTHASDVMSHGWTIKNIARFCNLSGSSRNIYISSLGARYFHMLFILNSVTALYIDPYLVYFPFHRACISHRLDTLPEPLRRALEAEKTWKFRKSNSETECSPKRW